jgi:hypothetical protein
VPIEIPHVDDRRFEDLVREAVARIPVTTPEWTNFTESDPGITLIELFAFLTESVIYRADQIPERNRRRFLQLLGLGLQPGTPAEGIVAVANERGPLAPVTLAAGLELRAGRVPFRARTGLEVLPVEARTFIKRPLAGPAPELEDYYRHLYASLTGGQDAGKLRLYETVPLEEASEDGVDLAQETIDGSLWIALLTRASDRGADAVGRAREALGGRTLSLGVVPALERADGRLTPTGPAATAGAGAALRFLVPQAGTGRLPATAAARVAQYATLDARATVDVAHAPGVVQLALPSADRLILWEDLDPLESGSADFPPSLEDSPLERRLVTWLRVHAAGAARIRWAGVNAVMVDQRAEVIGEALPSGTAEPGQEARLSRTPVLPGSVRLSVDGRRWEEIDDLDAARPEPDPGGAVFTLDPEAGRVRFGDGARGWRPPRGAAISADYAAGAGTAGNVAAGAISAAALPPGIKVRNPVRTWGGSDPERVEDGERQISGFLRHRDRMVTAEDCEAIVRRAPGADLGRVEVLSAFSPDLASARPGDSPGALTVMVVPRGDPRSPLAPRPDRPLVDAVCKHVEPRRLVTTEVFVRGPVYRPIWLSVGIEPVAGLSVAEVQADVSRALRSFLSPLPTPGADHPNADTGWPLAKPVRRLELATIAGRRPGVLLVTGALLAAGAGGEVEEVPLRGLELPEIAGLAVVAGTPLSLDAVRGAEMGGATGGPGGPGAPGPGGPLPGRIVPVPIVPETC